MADSQKRSAAFVRGFFGYLEEHEIRAAVLHGGADGFERDLSDVDFVVDHSTFPQLPGLIDAYCEQSGWQLCQILRHETTAAYFVCSALDDPACAVALDACSDYQRNGTVFLSAQELLEASQPLPWGAHGLNPSMKLRYRFAKAAAKGKDLAECESEFASYPQDARQACADWLETQWSIHIASCDKAGLAQALSALRKQSNDRPSLLQPGSLRRIISRMLHPTGLVVITGCEDFEKDSAQVEHAFGHLYFRRFRKAERFRPAFFKDLIASTLIVVPEIAYPWSQMIPRHCLYYLTRGSGCSEMAAHLHHRSKNRLH